MTLPFKPKPEWGIPHFVNATLTRPWTLESESTGIPTLHGMSMQDKVGFAVRVLGLAVLLAMAALAALTTVGVYAAWRRRRRQQRAAFFGGRGKERAPADGDGAVVFAAASLPIDGDASFSDGDAATSDASSDAPSDAYKSRTALELGVLRPLPPYAHPSPPSGLIALALVLASLVFRVLLIVVSFAATSSLQTHALASPTNDRPAFVAGVDWRWSLIRAQAFFDYGATTLYYAAMIAAARHFEPRLGGGGGGGQKAIRSLALVADGVVALAGVALWLAAWGVILADTKPDYDRPRRLWSVIGMGVREVDVHTALMAWTVLATLHVCAVLVAKVVVGLRQKNAMRPVSATSSFAVQMWPMTSPKLTRLTQIPKIVLTTFTALAVPTLLYQAAVHMIWGLTTRTSDWHDRPWEFRSQWMKTISIVATHPGEMLLLGMVVWAVQKLHRLRGWRGEAAVVGV
jgi:hypothetical protein